MALNSGIQTNQILTNDDEVCIQRLSRILLAVTFEPLLWMTKCCRLKLHNLRIAQPLCMYCQNEHPCMEFKQSLSVSVHCALWPEFPFFLSKNYYFFPYKSENSDQNTSNFQSQTSFYNFQLINDFYWHIESYFTYFQRKKGLIILGFF